MLKKENNWISEVEDSEAIVDEQDGLSPIYLISIKEKAVMDRKSFSLDWYNHLKQNHMKPLDRSGMRDVISGIHDLMRNGHLSQLNSIISEVLNENSSKESIVCVLRASFVAKSELKNWQSLLERSIGWLEKKGNDPRKILVGLI